MGCDIHPYWCAMTPDGVWHMIEEAETGRSYLWFGLAAGVRQQHEESLEPRGMPNNPSTAWQHIVDAWDRDLHSHSWLTPSEVTNINKLWVKKSYDDYGEPPEPDFDEEFIKVIKPDHVITKILLPSANGKLTAQPFAGTLAEFVGSEDIENKVRLVFAFDN